MELTAVHDPTERGVKPLENFVEQAWPTGATLSASGSVSDYRNCRGGLERTPVANTFPDNLCQNTAVAVSQGNIAAPIVIWDIWQLVNDGILGHTWRTSHLFMSHGEHIWQRCSHILSLHSIFPLDKYGYT